MPRPTARSGGFSRYFPSFPDAESGEDPVEHFFVGERGGDRRQLTDRTAQLERDELARTFTGSKRTCTREWKKGAFERGAVTQAADSADLAVECFARQAEQRSGEQLATVAALGAGFHLRAAGCRQPLAQRRRSLWLEVHLVPGNHGVGAGQRFPEQDILLGRRGRCIDDEHAKVGIPRSLGCTHHGSSLGSAFSLAQAGGIGENETDATEVDGFLDYVAGGARLLGHDHAATSGQAVDEARFARVRPPGEDHAKPFAAAPRSREAGEKTPDRRLGLAGGAAAGRGVGGRRRGRGGGGGGGDL